MRAKFYLIFYLMSALWLVSAPQGLSAAIQQVEQKEVTGKVKDGDSGEPLIGATVMVKGTTNGTVTDIDGEYTIKIPSNDVILVFSYIGYTKQEVVVGTQSVIEITLPLDIEALDEVVVVGYGSVKKEDLTGSIALVSAKEFNKGAVNSPQELIVGKMAGVTVTSNSGAPGNSSTIRIRGGSSLNASNDPLIIVDDVPLDNNGVGGSANILSMINPNDIATFTVLKDASATAIYGSRAANGVIIITTKRGAKGFKVAYNFTGSLYTTPKKLDVYTGSEYRDLINSLYSEKPTITKLLGEANTDWQKQIYKNAFGQDHNVNLSGASDNTKYRVSLGYNNTDGVLKTYNFQRTTLSASIDQSLFNNKLKIQANIKGMLNNNNFAEQGAIGNAIYYDPTQPVFNGNTAWRGYTTWTVGGIDGTAINLAPANPVAQLALTDNTSEVMQTINNIKLDYELVKGLNATLNMGNDYTKSVGHNNVVDSTQWIYIPVPGGGKISNYEYTRESKVLDFYLKYAKEISEDSKFDFMVGYSWNYFYRSQIDSLMAENKTGKQGRDFQTDNQLVSYFGRANYSYKNKYMLTLTLRNDYSSRFAPENRSAIFPAAAFAWNIANESFIENSPVVSDLKLRLGYGQTGQQDIQGNDYPYLGTFTISDNISSYPFGGKYYNTLRPDKYDGSIKWESTTTYNAGIDFGFAQNRIFGSVDVYFKATKDLLNAVQVPAGTNFGTPVLTNIGNMENKGIELNLNGIIVDSGDWYWKLNVNAYYNQNKITKLNLNDDEGYYIPVGGTGGTTDGTIQAHKVGQSLSSFYVLQQIYDKNGKPLENSFVDRNGDGQIGTEDYYIYHSPAPKVILGFNTWVDYKQFSLAVNARANLGNYVYNNVASSTNYHSLYSSMQYLRNMSTQAEDTKFTTGGNTRFSDYYIENASFLRVDNINLAYKIPNAFNDFVNLTLSVGVQNAFMWTKYSGLDPEVNGGLDNNFYPRARVFLVGVRAEF